MGFTLCGLSARSDSDALFHLDPSSKCCLTTVMGLFVCTKANPRLSFLSLWCESFKMMCGGWTKQQCWQYLLICWFWTDRSKAMTQCASLITISTFAGSTQNPWPRFFLPPTFFLHKYASGFQVGFCSLCRHNADCGLRNNTVFREHGKKTARSNLHIILCKGTPVNCVFKQVWLSTGWKKKHLESSQSSDKLHKQHGPRKKICHEPTPVVIEVVYLFIFLCFSKKHSEKVVTKW